MRSVGVDVASVGLCAVALAIDGIPETAITWKPSNLKESHAAHLQQQHSWLRWQLAMFKPDIIAVEQLQVFQNKKVIRSLAMHEGVMLLAAKQTGCPVVLNPPVSTVRRIVVGKGNASKDDAWAFMKKRYPDFDWGHKTTGGTDKCDAMIQALAAPVVAEGR